VSNYNSTCFAILATPRSGSSVLSGIVHSLGVNMGSRLMVAGEHNEKGFYEDMEFLEIHRHMYGTIPYLFDDPIAKNKELLIPAYINLVRKKCVQKLWGVKDPRMVFLVSTLHKYLTSTCELKIISTSRPLHLSSESMKKVIKVEYDRAYEIISRYEEARKESLKWAEELGIPTLSVTYEDLMTNTKDCVGKIAAFCGVEDPTTISMAGLLVDKSLWHNR